MRSSWVFETPEDRAFWGELWAERVQHSDLARQAVDYGLATATELAAMGEAFRDWLGRSDGRFVVVHGEVIARAPR